MWTFYFTRESLYYIFFQFFLASWKYKGIFQNKIISWDMFFISIASWIEYKIPLYCCFVIFLSNLTSGCLNDVSYLPQNIKLPIVASDIDTFPYSLEISSGM